MFSADSPLIKKLEKLNEWLDSLSFLKVLTSGLTMILPVIIVGAFSSLFANFPVESYQEFIQRVGLKEIFTLGGQFSTNIISLIAVMSITYVYVQSKKIPAIIPSIISLIAFLILTPLELIDETTYISFEWLGSAGFFVAILTAFAIGKLYVIMIKNEWILKMPKSVPTMVSQSFASLVPSAVIILIAMILRYLFSLTGFGNIHSVIFTLIQTPITNLGNSLVALIIITLLSRLLWMMGIHGMLVLMPILLTVFMPLDLQNLEAYTNGQPLPNIVGLAFWILCTSIGGGGATLGLNFLMAFNAKSEQYKTLGKLSLPSGIFGINEPLIYGIPIVFNALYAIPYIFAPIVNLIIGYFLIQSGLVPAPSEASILGMPIPIFFVGLIQGSWKLGVMQIFFLVINTIMYYPFFKAGDRTLLLKEQEKEAEYES
ncbi:MAG TPA: PTS sugar transporter subunit IIC [Bavariicoccus seileri]|uniref:Permease IIC component n=1 Tax=Bavariicoccus seileri TaxID=549685 RepID=A0A3D4S3F9_9ENTE|nr:PTS transporter subunit EIIC [Bavariicoccus seileri]HCS93353.1 PTS sugar transporter subunit IIC [Bavariicoccus seileri]